MRTLNTPAPAMTGCDTAARSMPAAADAQRSRADAEYEPSATRWPEAERAFLQAIRQLEHARDPLVADAWAGLARSVRYQKGRRDDRITAAVTSLYWDRSNKTAWAELADLASAAPHVPTLPELLPRASPRAATGAFQADQPVPWPGPAGKHAPCRWRAPPSRASRHRGARGRQANGQEAIH
jgi:hypothetical protein